MSQDVGEADRIDLDRLRSQHEGVEVSMDLFQVWTFRDGLAVKHESFLEREVALRAAGLSEQAMSQENVEIVRAGIEAFNRRDWDGALSDATPGFKIDMSRAVGPISGGDVARERRGHPAFLRGV